MIGIPWAQHVSNGEVLKKMETKSPLIRSIRKKSFRAHKEDRALREFDTHRPC